MGKSTAWRSKLQVSKVLVNNMLNEVHAMKDDEQLTTTADDNGMAEEKSGKAPTAPPTTIAELRSAKIEQFERAALGEEDALVGAIGGEMADLLRLGLLMGTFFKEILAQQTLAQQPVSMKTFEQLMPQIDTRLKVMRQVDRFAQFIDQRRSSDAGHRNGKTK